MLFKHFTSETGNNFRVINMGLAMTSETKCLMYIKVMKQNYQTLVKNFFFGKQKLLKIALRKYALLL